MTDLSSLIYCITLLAICFKVISFLKWYFKNEHSLSDSLQAAWSQRDDFRLENERLLKEIDRLTNPLTDLDD